MPKEKTFIREKENTNLREPRRYKVVLYNDDFTTMEFVVMLLMKVFNKNETEAETLMLQVHHSGQAVVGVYSLDIAATKVQKATQMADEAGFPLRIVLLPE
ncbi:MAG: ATP-dependent Clp protease adaptor ClpS [Prevotella sp.]|jgi:ATP-dependent Clp protease adaptor protein ClpS|nr:ATP-dependent Clp protease adaptor ClpS [Prevotella sp.]MBQ1589004.1 ATP-dependent Clp protease adaptor ClpS [Prevotella sp.]MBQ1646283.1 ATP-dependent Clp protease adaptor ClpS [Prevotella sp.]MBQ1701818.1 ATP-dependent Clp protease adaptor ClpS [Prevotella sp.]MBQ1758277.1 ATP-dependent Clp protease adaptor ClpS [Prevotella sp.]